MLGCKNQHAIAPAFWKYADIFKKLYAEPAEAIKIISGDDKQVIPREIIGSF